MASSEALVFLRELQRKCDNDVSVSCDYPPQPLASTYLTVAFGWRSTLLSPVGPKCYFYLH